jgi:L-fuconolactonase
MPRQNAPRETILEPDLPIVDAHHHLWDMRPLMASLPPDTPPHALHQALERSTLYLLDRLAADTGSGHNVIATVFMECGSMYRARGPEDMRVVGEVEFANGIAAMAASGQYGPALACHGIVGYVPLPIGDRAAPVLEAMVAAGNGRFRGIRNACAYDADPEVFGVLNHPAGLYADSQFRQGFRHLARLGLSFDAWLGEPQIGELTDLARAFPDTRIVLDHAGTPLGRGRYAGTQKERFPIWAAAIRELAQHPNVYVKLGGLSMPFCNFPSTASGNASSQTLADDWRPYVETCIEAFGAKRAMFESNFPVDEPGCSYVTQWNAFKRLASGASQEEKAALFAGTAAEFYRLTL